MTPITMNLIESQAKAFATARAELAERMNALREEQDAIKRRRLQGIKNALDRVQNAHTELRESLEAGRELFDNPKTRVLHGIRVGWMKQRGKLEIADPEACVAALRRLLGEEAAAYIKVSEAPVRSALANLPAKDLKRVGVAVADDIDVVVIKPADGELDKLIDALINDADLAEAALT
ncbi:MAG: hypothetical protein F9K31_06575 [Dokdonella sp.]|nr:MAG: hypothetical protein F9K31_06575 [Dokdonella sp.]